MKKLLFFIVLIFIATNIRSQQWVIYTPYNSGLPDSFVGSILIDSNNVKWITTSNGFVRLKGNSWTVYDTINSGLPQNACYPVTKDKQNNLWIGTANKGIAKFDGVHWTIYNLENTGLPINYSISIVFDNNNTKWIGGGGGVYKFNDTIWIRYYPGNSGQPSNMVRNLFYKNNILWVGTYDKGLIKYDGQNWTVYNFNNSGLPSNEINMIKSDIYDNIWISTFWGGVAKFNTEQNIWTVYNTGNSGLQDNNTLSIYVDNNNVKWIGASGLAIYNDTTWQIFPYPFLNDVLNFEKDKYGNMWICVAGGLYVYNPNGVVGIENISTIVPENFVFLQNYPNPFNPTTKIKISIPESTSVLLNVYDVNGKLIKELTKGKFSKGVYEYIFNGSNLASGVYFVMLKTDTKTKVHKIILQK